MGYPDPVYSQNAVGTNTSGLTVDISNATDTHAPPIMTVELNGVVGYTIEGSHDNLSWSVFYTDSAPIAKDLIIGLRFWRTSKQSGAGTITSIVGPGVTDGKLVQMRNYQVGPDNRTS